ncbi:MAG: aldehyde dehydrogenase family protein, partial [Pseudohongiellaceae bacterium]
FTPWNFPVYLMAKKLAAALAAGSRRGGILRPRAA